MELWFNQKTREVIYAEANRICYDITWVCLGKSKGIYKDIEMVREIRGWFKVY
jgi:hypothetical protein